MDLAPGMLALARRPWPAVAFRCADAHRLPFDDARFDAGVFADLLRGAGLDDITVDRLELTHRLPSADVLWDGVLHGAVRIAALVRGQSPDMQRRIRRAFDRIVERYKVGDGIELPVAVKIAAGRRATR